MTLPQRPRRPRVQTPTLLDVPKPNSSEKARAEYVANRPRAAYHLDRETPAHMMVKSPGLTTAVVPVPHMEGVQFRGVEVGQARSGDTNALYEHPMERNDFKHFTGQQVIPLKPPDPYAGPQQLDDHGNVHERGPSTRALYNRYGPDRSAKHEDFWHDHGKVQQVNAQAVLHTGQHDEETGSHSYITGPLDPHKPAANVMIHNGTPYIMDGHHRIAEHRGRGHDTFPANVVNMDQMRDAIAAQHGVKRENVQVYPGQDRDKQVEVSHWNRQQRMALP